MVSKPVSRYHISSFAIFFHDTGLPVLVGDEILSIAHP